jgi:hypothetical protein
MIKIDPKELKKPAYEKLAKLAYENYAREFRANAPGKTPKGFNEFCQEKGWGLIVEKRPTLAMVKG